MVDMATHSQRGLKANRGRGVLERRWRELWRAGLLPNAAAAVVRVLSREEIPGKEIDRLSRGVVSKERVVL